MSTQKTKPATIKGVAAKDTNSEKRTPITAEQRYQMIADAAYFLAEKRGFVGGDVAQDWLEAEAQIDFMLRQTSSANQ